MMYVGGDFSSPPLLCRLRTSYIQSDFFSKMSSKHKMRLMLNNSLLLLFASLMILSSSAAAQIPMAKPGCQETCGNVTIPYPFGIGGRNCYLNPWFEITCNHSLHSRPFLRKLNLEVLEFRLDSHHHGMEVNHPIYSTCRDGSSWNSADLRGSPFQFDHYKNRLMTIGCENNILMRNRTKQVVAGCTSTCGGGLQSSYGCYGINCCMTSIPFDGSDFYSLTSTVINTSVCTYAFLANYYWFPSKFLSDPSVSMVNQDHVPVFLSWGVNISDLPAGVIINNQVYRVSYSCQNVYDTSLFFCECDYTYEGNPYIENGCRVVPACTKCKGRCDYGSGEYYCRPNRTREIIIAGAIGGGGAVVIFASFCFGMYKIIKRRRELKLKKKFFKRNGGLLLQQQLSSNGDSFDTIQIFTANELEKATDSFNINRVLGQGGQGTVYKGMLIDGTTVAVKKSKLVDESQVEQFINEIFILSQINHRNIVKLLGCCLETEVPLLVYQYIPNGTLSQLIRNPEDEFSFSWKMRLQIATEISGALSYLHSASSLPIYHRDIKSSNILLDDKYRAKVADFGTSRSVAIDNTHLTTIVKGTFGYLDPEFFRSSQFTDKSDVYSFGVVLAELLTGEKPIMSRAGQSEKSLAAFFISTLEEDSLFNIIDENVAKEGSIDEIIALAIIAKRCLNMNGRQRPTMKEVMLAIERIIASHRPSNVSNQLHHVQSIRESNRMVEDAFNSKPFP